MCAARSGESLSGNVGLSLGFIELPASSLDSVVRLLEQTLRPLQVLLPQAYLQRVIVIGQIGDARAQLLLVAPEFRECCLSSF